MRNRSLQYLAIIAVACCCLPVRLSAEPDQRGTLSGHITDETGKPLVADVLVYGRAIVYGRLDVFAMCSTATDPDGHYECKLREGSYLVSATAKPDATQSVKTSTTVQYPRTFFPHVTDIASAEPIAVVASGSATADVAMQGEAPGEVHGELPGHPKDASFLVRAHTGQLDLPTQAKLSYDPATGRFAIENLAPGSYSITADWAIAQVPHHEYGIVQVTSTEDRNINLMELTWHEVEGTLHTGDGSTANSLPQSIELEGGADHPGWKMEATVKSDGSFRFPPVVDGRYVLRPSPGSESYVDSISSSGKTVSGDRMTLNPGTGNMQVSVTLGVSHANLTGTLGTEDVIPDKTGVVLESLADGSVSIAMADRSGAFDFRNLAPGEYRAYAWSDLDKAEYRNPSFLARFKDKSKDITIDAQYPVSS